MTSNAAIKRLKTEYQRLLEHPTEGISARPIKDENLFLWKAVIAGPPGTCYEGGLFKAKLQFPQSYPMKPLKMQFTSDMFHPNIYRDGRVCISILQNPLGDDRGLDRWCAAQSVEKILLSVISLLAEPNPKSPANHYAAHLWLNDRQQYNLIVKRTVDKTRVNAPP